MTKPKLEENQVDLTPMIDVVFLLLIFFMVTMRIVQEETQLEVPLPQSMIDIPPPPFPPQEIEVEIAGDGKVMVDGIPVGEPGNRNLTDLANYFYRQGQLAIRSPDNEVLVSIKPDKMARHKYTTNVLNALAQANEGLEELQGSVPRGKRKVLNKIAFH